MLTALMSSKRRGMPDAWPDFEERSKLRRDPRSSYTPHRGRSRAHKDLFLAMSMISSGGFLVVRLWGVKPSRPSAIVHHASSRPYNDIDKEHVGGAFRLDDSPVPQPSQPRAFILQPRASLVWRSCLIIVSDIWRREAVQKRGHPDPQELTDGTIKLVIRGLESRKSNTKGSL